MLDNESEKMLNNSLSTLNYVDESEPCVQWAFLVCRECRSSGPAFRHDVLYGMDKEEFEAYRKKNPDVEGYDWDVLHSRETGHSRFFRWLLQRSHVRVFWP